MDVQVYIVPPILVLQSHFGLDWRANSIECAKQARQEISQTEIAIRSSTQ
jgi:hypothetical protein